MTQERKLIADLSDRLDVQTWSVSEQLIKSKWPIILPLSGFAVMMVAKLAVINWMYYVD
tara:strand:- start:635 stop:811 length:177 start_codon:yes stop_codon:yes gene_type:complete